MINENMNRTTEIRMQPKNMNRIGPMPLQPTASNMARTNAAMM